MTSGAVEPMEVESDSSNLDEALYSRQLYVLGREAMSKMATSNVLIYGLNGLGVEIAKNIILAGVKSVTLLDDKPVEYEDLSSHFYASEKDVGKPRAATCFAKLAELNQYVQVSLGEGPLANQNLSQFKVLVMCMGTLSEQLAMDEACREAGTLFISTSTRGAYGSMFVDFGSNFVITDTNGEPEQSIMIANVTQDNPGVVTCLDETRHPYEDGDFITFREVKGMSELNGCEPREIKTLGPYSFSIGDTSGFGKYEGAGYACQVKKPKSFGFLSMKEAIAQPEYVISDFAKMERMPQLHLAFQALGEFESKYDRLPATHDVGDAENLISIAEAINASAESKVDEVDKKLLRRVSFVARGSLSPMQSVFGGIAGQEVLKGCSGKFMPTRQWFYFDCEEALPDNFDDADKSLFEPCNSRYDGQVAVIGRKVHEDLMNLRYFLVGAGAIGCEMLKCWAMMGLGGGPEGLIHVTDGDTIEKSNLNRQFLFRSCHVQQLKSEVACEAAKAMNPDLSLKSWRDRVGPDTETVFNEDFMDSLSGVCNALDNVEARMYMDQRCVLFQKPLLDSGTLGTKGNVQVVIPFTTEAYSSSTDPPEKSIPICTLKNFPNQIEHTIQWARDLFEGVFRQCAEDVNSYLSNSDFLAHLNSQGGSVKKQTLEHISDALVQSRPLSFDDCIVWARNKFEDLFHTSIAQLLYCFPADQKTSSGAPFWSGPKRCPDPLQFDDQDPLHINFVLSAANLRAAMFGLKGDWKVEQARQVLSSVIIPEFVPKQGVKIQVNENENEGATDPDDDLCARLESQLPKPGDLAGFRLNPVEFEKDDDTNYHMDFITAASNLRARNYRIEEADTLRTKQIAGKIIPAIATTTALVTGLVNIEIYKLIQKRALDAFKNGFVNLALPFFGFSEPIAAPKFGRDWTLWDRIDMAGEITLREFLKYFQDKHGLEVSMLSYGVSILFSSFSNKKKIEERMDMNMSDVAELVSKVKINEGQKYINFTVYCMDEDYEDVECPTIRYKINRK